MRTKLSFIFVYAFILLTTNLIGQTLPSGNEIHEFMSKGILKENKSNIILASKSERYFINKDSVSFLNDTTHFSQKDIKYLRLQLKKLQEFEWNDETISGAEIINSKKLERLFKKKDFWEKYYKKYDGSLNFYSMPIFNLDKTYCIIQIGSQSYKKSGGGATYLYKFINGEWIKEKIYSFWES